jgi:hypothetical protein
MSRHFTAQFSAVPKLHIPPWRDELRVEDEHVDTHEALPEFFNDFGEDHAGE